MQLNVIQKSILAFVTLYTVGFGAFYVTHFDYEFIAYVVLMVVVFGVIFGTLHITRFPNFMVAGLALWGLMHMMGGSVVVNGAVLYAWHVFPFFDGGGDLYILKFDQVVHAFLYAVVAMMFLHLFETYYGITHSRVFTTLIAIMAALGVSAMNEIVEFTAVLLAPENGVGGYFNTMLDFVSNLVGAIIGACLYPRLKRPGTTLETESGTKTS